MPTFRHRLSPTQRAEFDASDAATAVRLRIVPRLARAVSLLPLALSARYGDEREQRRKVRKVAQVVCDEVCRALGVPSPQVVVKGKRPVRRDGEYHGLYESEGDAHCVTVWIYTAKRRQAVAPRTLLRTLAHELIHHLDFHKLGLSESFHTDGFFKRESSLVRQLERAAQRAATGQMVAPPVRTATTVALDSSRADDTGGGG